MNEVIINNSESLKVQYTVCALAALFIGYHFFTKFAVVSVDSTAFIILLAMGFVLSLSVKSLLDIINICNEHKHQAIYETLKSNILLNTNSNTHKNVSKNNEFVTSIN